MLINNILSRIQGCLKPLYEKSYILQKIDWLICVNIFLVIFSSLFALSDNIGYFALAAIMLTLIKLLTKSGEGFELNTADKLLLVYFIVVIISVTGSSLLYLSLKGFFKTLTYVGFYVSVVHFLRDNKDFIKWILAALTICALIEVFFAFMQNIGMVEEIAGWQDMSRINPEDVMTRVYGTLKPLNPNLLGGYLLAILPSFVVLPFINKKLLLVSILGFVATTAAIIATGCRGAYIGTFIELLALILLSYRFIKQTYKKMFSYITSAIIVLISLAVISVNSIRVRIFSIFAMRNDSSNSFRFNVYNSCINMFKDNWLLGIGCGNQNFREIYGLYMKTGFDALSAYNIYLETAVESGVFALISFTAFLISNIIKAVKYILGHKTIEAFFVMSALISIIGMLTHGMVDTVFFRPQIQFIFWIMIGIIRVLV